MIRLIPPSRALTALAALLATCVSSLVVPSEEACAAVDRHAVIRTAQQKVVKIYGAGRLRQMEAYQTGILISAEGHVLTALSYVLDTDELTIVLDDGRKFETQVTARDPLHELALLQLPLENESVAYFDLLNPATVATGERVYALSNLYGIATGDEAVSALHGVVTAVAPLDARRGMFQSNYRGEVYVLDAQANNPGAAGGALIDRRGSLVGVLGKELKSRVTGSWLHYAIPIRELSPAIEAMISGQDVELAAQDRRTAAKPLKLDEIGLALAPNVLPRTPPFIDVVSPGSPAAEAGLRPDDLVVFVDGEPTPSITAVTSLIEQHEAFQSVAISVLRDGRLIEVVLSSSFDEVQP